ncbi:MAG: DUF4013 domain-containing protein [Anaerolineales bacterium]|nr:DUF4013 domain-containing protein [Anaerolineales bacterium]
MDFGLAFSYVFEDKDWVKKLALASVLCLTVIGIIPVLGWGLEVMKRVIKEDPEPLPNWSEFGQYFVKGLLVVLVGFVYSLPVIVIGSCNAGAGALLGNTGEDFATPLIWILTTCLSCLYILYGVGISLVIPAALGNYAASGEFGSVFKLGEIFRIVRNNLGNYGLVFLGLLLSNIIAPLGGVACGIGIAVTTAYAILFNSHLMGQAYKVAGTGGDLPADPIPDAS